MTDPDPVHNRMDHSPSPAAQGHLLVIDCNHEAVVNALHRCPISASYDIQVVEEGVAAVDSILSSPPLLILLDPHSIDECGFELHRRIRAIDKTIPVIFISERTTPSAIIEAAKQGAFDFLFKPLNDEHFHRVIAEARDMAVARRSDSVRVLPSITGPNDGLLGESRVMRDVYKAIGLVAGQEVNVLITGETGTGKELVARAIHQHSTRSRGPYLALNCAAIPENLLESELFGHEKGAFSGADRRRIGKFEQCDGGTILLDEIGDMPLALQAKLLRLLQEQTFERVGGNETLRTNVRLIASTHRDLKSWSLEGKFRTDLYYRLSVFGIHLPPLRQRGCDLALLIRHFVHRYGREMGRNVEEIAPDALERLTCYPWPGNIRELQSVIQQAVLRCYGSVLLSAYLPPTMQSPPESRASATRAGESFDVDAFLRQRLSPTACDVYGDLHRELDRHALRQVLAYTQRNQRTAARLLGIARQTLRTKLRECGLYVTSQPDTDDDAM